MDVVKDIDPDTIKGIAKLLYGVRTDEQVKLRYGARVREHLKAKLKGGEKVSGYRAEWLLSSRKEVVLFLGSLADHFNQEHPHDRASVADLTDICAAVMQFFKKGTI
jgi:hypothetical protein